MKKFLILTIMAGAMAFVVPSAEAKTTSAAAVAAPQIRIQLGGRRNRQPVRSTVRTRITHVGRATYRETIRVTRLPNGRTREQVISRVRIGGRG